MKDIRHLFGLKRKKPLRLGLLLLSTLLIITASALVYARVVYEQALNVGDTSGTTGSGSTAPAEVSFTPASIMMLAVAALIVGLSIFGFLRQASRHLGTPPGRRPLPSKQGEEWEESPTKEEDEE